MVKATFVFSPRIFQSKRTLFVAGILCCAKSKPHRATCFYKADNVGCKNLDVIGPPLVKFNDNVTGNSTSLIRCSVTTSLMSFTRQLVMSAPIAPTQERVDSN